jgi:hypothetical protein
VIPHGKREVKVTWTLRARRSGARVLLYAGSSVGNGVPLAEVAAVAGLNSYEYLDRSGRDGRWVYWLVVVEDHARRAILGSLVCVSPSMDEGPASALPHLRAVLAEWPRTEPPVQRWALPAESATAGELLLEAPPAPPPEAS